MSEDSCKAPIDIEGIKRLIPHRYPFLFVDRIVEVSDPVSEAAALLEEASP